jgi:hypothetical protein
MTEYFCLEICWRQYLEDIAQTALRLLRKEQEEMDW